MAEIMPKIALLSTGDEIINGDVLNTNSQTFAHLLFAENIQPGQHATASDDQAEIEQTIRFLLAGHAGLIITGGLGPTSDDRTRFALAKVLDTELVFDEACWRQVMQRLQRLSLPIPDTNRQQCLFPRNAIIFSNDNGTAAGCLVMHGRQPVFMLPGPPFECLPIFEKQVLPYLQTHGFARPLLRCEWLLLGVSEGSIAALLDPLMENSDCYVGYRINPPYLEVKLQSAHPQAFEKLRAQFQALIGGQSISTQKQKASAQLIALISALQIPIQITDHATGGALSAAILTLDTYPYLHFNEPVKGAGAIQIVIRGLENYWRRQPSSDLLNISLSYQGHSYDLSAQAPFRQARTVLYAVEIACREILECLKAIPKLK